MRLINVHGYGCKLSFRNKQPAHKIIKHHFFKDLLPNTLESIAALLLSKAKEKNADDERIISQGIYNLFFGTVELMMVSAEAAAIGKEGKTLSSEQLKVGFLERILKQSCNDPLDQYN